MRLHRWAYAQRRALAWVSFVLIFAVALYVQQIRSDSQIRANQVEVAHLLRTNQLEACDRGNKLRKAVATNAAVNEEFLAEASATRQESATSFRRQGNIAAAEINQDASDKYAILGDRLVAIPIVDCKKVIR